MSDVKEDTKPADNGPAFTMADAIAGVESRIKLAPDKIPEGKVLIGIYLKRTQKLKGDHVENIGRLVKLGRRVEAPAWLTFGVAVALRDGRPIAGNTIYGRWSRDEAEWPVPKVGAMHYIKCKTCGGQYDQPSEVFRAKDMSGQKIENNVPARVILDTWGDCPRCKAKGEGWWDIDRAREKALVTELADKVMETFTAATTPVPPFRQPTAFTLDKEGLIPPEWEWLRQAVNAGGRKVAPFASGDLGEVLIYNPGFWCGYVDDPDDTGLFWREKGGRRGESRFDPAQVAGL